MSKRQLIMSIGVIICVASLTCFIPAFPPLNVGVNFLHMPWWSYLATAAIGAIVYIIGTKIN